MTPGLLHTDKRDTSNHPEGSCRDHQLRVLALMDTAKISGPCRGLFQLVKLTRDTGVRFVLGMFLTGQATTTPAIAEATRRGFHTVLLVQRRRYDANLIFQTWRIIRAHNINLVQSHSYKPAFMAWCLKRLTGLPWLAFTHGYTSENKRMALYNRLDRWLLKRADRVIVVSEALKRQLTAAGVAGDRIQVIHNAIDPADHVPERDGIAFRRQCAAGPQELLVGVIGRFSPEKGHTVFLDAFRTVVKVLPRTKAVFIGDGQDSSRLQAMVHALGLEERVVFAGHQSDMSPVYSALDLIVIPSFSEGLPNVLLEAMLHGKAVVATAVGGIPEVMSAGLSDWLVPPADPLALADKMIAVLESPALRTAIGEAGQSQVRARFTPEARARQMAAVYHELTAQTAALSKPLIDVILP